MALSVEAAVSAAANAPSPSASSSATSTSSAATAAPAAKSKNARVPVAAASQTFHLPLSSCWPSSWLATDFPTARLLTVEYPAPFTNYEVRFESIGSLRDLNQVVEPIQPVSPRRSDSSHSTLF